KIDTIRTWGQYFLTLFFILAFSGTATFAEESITDDSAPSTPTTSKQYISTLETTINDYEKIAENGGWASFKIGKTIKIDEHDSRIPNIRKILTVMGDYKNEQNEDEQNSDSDVFDEELLEAVKYFQVRHGLDADGVIGMKTQSALAVPVEFRLAQMQTTLERIHEMPDLGERYVLVNIPGFYLKAIDGNTTAINSRIIVGSQKNATPLFHRSITDVSFNPPWYVPERIARNELMGKLRTNPEYFRKGNYVVTDSDGEKVDTANIDWENQSGSYRFVQRAGATSALGKVKFNLPNTNNIYLHSTGNPKLFSKTERALSHGCIRVEQARELAFFVMNGLTGWDEERIAKLYDSNKSKILPIEPVQVYLAYWTSWVDEATGKPHFSADIYGRDKKRVSELLSVILSKKESNDLEVAMK
ncbi:MAG: L,D-transpeptidase family protein, partial [Rickettsiales bacterium]